MDPHQRHRSWLAEGQRQVLARVGQTPEAHHVGDALEAVCQPERQPDPGADAGGRHDAAPASPAGSKRADSA